MKPIVLTVLLAITSSAALQAKDHSFIERLPQRLAAAQKEGHTGWDTGNTGTMREATYHFNDTLTTMINELVKHYYSNRFLPASRTRDYVTALYTVESFKQDASNPSGESQGTEANLEIAAGVSEDLEDTISKMVESIIGDDQAFDFKDWKRKWDKSMRDK